MKQPIIFGISSTRLTDEEKALFAKNIVTGFILFRRNIESKDQLSLLINELKSLYSHEHKVQIFIDQEGGRVARLKPPIIDNTYPDMKFFADMSDTRGLNYVCNAVKSNFFDLMTTLKRLDIDSPCAPVADLLSPITNNIIGDRSFGNEVQKVVTLCNASISGIETAGGIAIIKHIPGHGRAISDSHLELPVVEVSLEQLNKTDFEIFRQLAQHNKSIWAMTAHIIFNALDDKLPVTLSRDAIKFIREDIGFTGTLLSDDICMHALHQGVDINNIKELTQSIYKVTKDALYAGCDIILHCNGRLEEMEAVLLATSEYFDHI